MQGSQGNGKEKKSPRCEKSIHAIVGMNYLIHVYLNTAWVKQSDFGLCYVSLAW